MHVSALKLPEGCQPADVRTDYTVVTIVPPTVFEEETPAAAAATPGAAPAAGAPAAAPGAAAAAAPRDFGRRPGRRRRSPPPRRPRARRRRAGQAGRQEVTRRPNAPVYKLKARPPLEAGGPFFDASGHASHRRPRQSRRAPRPATATTSASWRCERSPTTHRIGPFRARFQGLVAEGLIGQSRVALLLPQTYMNESGRSVGEAMRFYKLGLDAIVVIHDELDLAPAKVRVKVGGGAAGHNGLRSITAHIGNDYKRVRIGIGHPGDKALVYNFVLGDFAKSEMPWVEAVCDAVARGRRAARRPARTRASRTRPISRSRRRGSAARRSSGGARPFSCKGEGLARQPGQPASKPSSPATNASG